MIVIFSCIELKRKDNICLYCGTIWKKKKEFFYKVQTIFFSLKLYTTEDNYHKVVESFCSKEKGLQWFTSKYSFYQTQNHLSFKS